MFFPKVVRATRWAAKLPMKQLICVWMVFVLRHLAMAPVNMKRIGAFDLLPTLLMKFQVNKLSFEQATLAKSAVVQTKKVNTMN